MAPEPVVRETLRLVLPRLDDAAALVSAHGPAEAKCARLRHLNLIDSTVRVHGAATVNHVGIQPNSHLVAWGNQTPWRARPTRTRRKPQAPSTLPSPAPPLPVAAPRGRRPGRTETDRGPTTHRPHRHGEGPRLPARRRALCALWLPCTG
ncbi:hypothetical protein [Streptomyces halobius]|uniref:Uncharacterized protein n=1 Tax=Streptomyces halobius TaxID=2879846 RepID=A0ABY4MG76_9ACTN|nr:hypothetical protein [Streptomyces halobius]UQA96702.1 hypothetical protein K9S39_36860 [Streptomyces halobius]